MGLDVIPGSIGERYRMSLCSLGRLRGLRRNLLSSFDGVNPCMHLRGELCGLAAGLDRRFLLHRAHPHFTAFAVELEAEYPRLRAARLNSQIKAVSIRVHAFLGVLDL